MENKKDAAIESIIITTVNNGYAVKEYIERDPHFESIYGRGWVFESMDSLQTWMKANLKVHPGEPQ